MARLLTDRQADLLRLLCAGHSREDAAGALGVSAKAVRDLLGRIRTQLGATAPAELCRRGAPDIAAIERERNRPPG